MKFVLGACSFGLVSGVALLGSGQGRAMDSHSRMIQSSALSPYEEMGDESVSAAIIAAQLRRQGVSCTRPRMANRDKGRSMADVTAWTLECDEATFRVKLIPHIGARVSTIGRHSN